MRRFIFFIAGLVLISLIGFSQDQSIADSLYQVMDRMEQRDTTRLKILTLIAQNENTPEQKLRIAEQLLSKAEKVQSNVYQHNALLQMGQAHRILGDFDKAIECLLKALEYAEKAGFQRGIVASSTAIADTYSIFGNYESAVAYYQKSIADISEQDSSILAVTLLNLGDTFYMIESYDSALRCFESSREIYEKLGDRSGLAYNLGNIGLVQAEMGERQKAEDYIGMALSELEQLGDHYGSCIFLGFLSDIYLEDGLVNEAIAFADSCLMIAKTFGLKTEIRDNLLRLANFSERKGDIERAYRYHKEYTKVKEEVSSEEVYERIESLESSYQLTQKQVEVDLLKAQRKNQQSVIVIATLVIFAFAILVIVIFIYYRSKIRVNRLLQRQKSSLERLNETKDKFFSIISHDLRGPISSLMGVSHLIRHFVEDEDEKQLLKMADHMEMSVNQLTALLDNLLNWAMQQQGHFPNVPEKVDFNALMTEIVSMFSNMAAGKKINISYQYNDTVTIWVDRNSVHTIFRNLINNAIKFTGEGGSVIASSRVDNDYALIEVQDTGIGIPQKKLNEVFSLSGERSTYGTAGEKGLGLGLQLVQEFVQMNGGKIKVESVEGEGTTFKVWLPLFDREMVPEKAYV